MTGNLIFPFLIFFPMICALVSYLFGRKKRILGDRIAAFCGIIEFTAAMLAVFTLGDGAEFAISGFCVNGISFVFDGFRRVYTLVIAFMWLMTLLFSQEYMLHYDKRSKYWFFNLLTLGATMGVFLSADLYTTFIFFEIMSFTSYVWVAFDETPAAMRAANTYLAVAVIGGMVSLMGLFLVSHELGTLRIDELYSAACASDKKGVLYAACSCVLFGFGAKAGMFPLHIWLPKAHPVAPAPSSALLSGILTKTGIFGVLAVSVNIFRNDPIWGNVILALGVITMFLGAVLALLSTNLKRTLACSSMSQIGFILVGIGMVGLLGEESAFAARGVFLHMVNHSLFKLLLFMVAGTVFMNLHELDLNKIRGFGRGKPVLHFCYLMGALGIGCVPLWSGYISKTLLHESIIEYMKRLAAGGLPYLEMKGVEWLFLLSGGLTLAYMTKLYAAIFIEKPSEFVLEHQKKKYMNGLSTFALCATAVIFPVLGIFPNALMDKIADLGNSFLHGGALAETVNYFIFEDLKGAIISVAIGAFMYFVITRKLLMKNGEYINVLPAKLDLEELLYRPLITKLIPDVFGAVARIFGENVITVWLCKSVIMPASQAVSKALSNFPDTIILFIENNFYQTLKEKEPQKSPVAYTVKKGHRHGTRNHLRN